MSATEDGVETTEVTTDRTTDGTTKGTTKGRSTRARGTLLPRVRRLAPWVLAVALVAVGVVGLVQAVKGAASSAQPNVAGSSAAKLKVADALDVAPSGPSTIVV